MTEPSPTATPLAAAPSAALPASATFRVGQAIDVHAFATPEQARGKTLMVACLPWPDETPLEGHSDGDVAAHALCDAILGACALGDMGTVFGTDRPQWQGASGEAFLVEVVNMAAAAGWRLGNATVQVIGNKPRMAARLPQACERMTLLAQGPVSVSATTTDGLGFTGRGEGLAALASVLMVPISR
ncbi:2-C-methyl-D-erythritol 2,4-cyclodiphosphate synthase [Schaalia suimastitidis]|uniref:2-C-methyl-D-erythritol 2,4-cyclodiphosphate synthase n=1 Tax=Schaalia suimastitidis TaxID=121163 RepID=UPI0004087919|nr:2-C-methyl-D-erythritol 2,4-cyclodiphosphate synthase [Schaalia suimastitidis]